MKWWQFGKRDADLERELQSDLELEEEEQRESGVAPEEARYAALRAFGNPSVISEQTREVWSWDRLETLLRDLRISIRTLVRSPGFSIIAVSHRRRSALIFCADPEEDCGTRSGAGGFHCANHAADPSRIARQSRPEC